MVLRMATQSTALHRVRSFSNKNLRLFLTQTIQKDDFLSFLLLFFIFFFLGLSGHNQRLEPVSAPGILSLVLNILCASLNVIRGAHLMENTFQVVPVQEKGLGICNT